MCICTPERRTPVCKDCPPTHVGRIEVKRNHIDEKLDDLADISEYWRRQRDRGYTPSILRTVMLTLCDEVRLLAQQESSNRQAQRPAAPADGRAATQG